MIGRMAAVVAALLTLVALVGAQPKPARPFTFILDFLPYGEYTPYFTALDKGWYREEGLDVKILRGAGSGDTIKRIAVGQGEAGSADFSALTGARANEDIRVKAIAAVLPAAAPLHLRPRRDRHQFGEGPGWQDPLHHAGQQPPDPLPAPRPAGWVQRG